MVVECGGGRHSVDLVDGELVLRDHDETAERVLGALGAGVPTCLRVADLWRDPPWHDVVPCLVLDDEAAAAAAWGKGAAADGLSSRIGTGASAVASRGVDRLRSSALLLGLPRPHRVASARRALGARVDSWRAGHLMDPTEVWLLERALDPFVGRRLADEGRQLPPGGRPVHVHVTGPDSPRALVPGRKTWDARIPVDLVDDVLFTVPHLSTWFAGD